MSEKGFRVFYRDYINGVSIPSTEPEFQPASGLPALAKQLMQSEDSFLGIMDAEDLIMQIYSNGGEQLVVELIYPESDGCYQTRMPADEIFELLGKLPEVFDESLLPQGRYIG